MVRIIKPISLQSLTLICLLSAKVGLAAQCELSIENEWNAGFTSSIKINNNSEQAIEGWQVQLHYPDGSTVSGAWNSSVTGNNPYTFTNANYNQTISPGGSASFGFNSQKATSGESPENPVLSGICNNEPAENLPEAVIEQDVTQGIIPLTVNFSGASSTSENDQIVAWQWDFGDGTSATGKDVIHTYQTKGNYQVQLKVFDNAGNFSIKSSSVAVSEPEPNEAKCEFFVENEWGSGFTGKVRITNESQYTAHSWSIVMAFPDNTSVSGTWNSSYSGNNPYTANNASYNSTITPGNFVEFGFNAQKAHQGDEVTAPSLSGFCRTEESPNTAPVAVSSASITSGNAPLEVQFTGSSSSDADNDPLTYLWDFGDGNSSTDINPVHSYVTPGSFSASLTVSDGIASSPAELLTITVTEVSNDGPVAYLLNNEKSSLWFVSTKKLHVVESHTFTQMNGELSEQGDASLKISLDSVDTAIETRNQRMRDFLFETSSYQDAEVLLSFDAQQISEMSVNSSQALEIDALLNLHGLSVPVSVSLNVSKLTGGALLVRNTQPVIINAADLNLDSGIETLKELASLTSISYAVPVNFHLVFEPQAAQE